MTGMKSLPKKNPIVTCFYCRCYRGSGFYKRAFIKYREGQLYGPVVTLIHYVGSLEDVVHIAHGNRKKGLQMKHKMTCKSVLTDIRKEVKLPPSDTYKKLTDMEINPPHVPVLEPRDSKQVRNTVDRERGQRLLSSDDMVGLYLFNEEISNFLRSYQLLPDFSVIFYSDSSISNFQSVCELPQTILYYDTTFNLGNFYVSALTYTHPLFMEKPVIPLAYLLHDKKTTAVHSQFLRHMRCICPQLDGMIIVTDRETAIATAICSELKNCKHLLCWNHSQRDVEYWLKSRKRKDVTHNDVDNYKSNV